MSKVPRSLNLEDFYRMYRIQMMEKGLTPKAPDEHKKIIKTMGEVMAEILLEEGIVAIPWRIGDIFLKQHRNGSEMLWQNINGKGVKTKFFNDHSDGIKYRAFWLSPERQQKKRKGWCFSLAQPVRDKLTALIRGGKRYADWQLLNPRSQFRGDKKRYA